MGHLTRLFRSLRCTYLVAAVVQFVVIAEGARVAVAVDGFWSNPAGGQFHESLNWSIGAPLPSGQAHFDLNNTYTVTFANAAVTDRLSVRRGRVTFDLGGHSYSLASDATISDLAADIATLTIAEGLWRSNTLRVGLESGQEGLLRVGTKARYEGAGETTIGLGGIGEAIVEAGAQASDARLSLGQLPTGAGKLTVRGAGSKWRANGNLSVGGDGIGKVFVLEGGAIEAGGDAAFAESASSSAQVQVSGNDASLQSNALVIARHGAADVTIADGGTIKSRLTTLAEFGGASANVTLTGAGTEWNAQSLFVGGTSGASGGDATVRVLDAAELIIDHDAGNELKIWQSGRLVVDGGSVRTRNFTRLGNLDFKNGLIEIAGGRFANAGPLLLEGDDPTANPTLHLRDGATTADITAVTVGRDRSGTLVISDSSIVAATELLIAELPGSTGLVTVAGVGSRLSLTGSMSVGGAADVAGGAGTLRIADRARVELPSRPLRVWPGGTISLDGGTLSVASYEPRGGTFDFSSGTFEVRSGTVVAGHSLLTHLLGPAHDVPAARHLRLPNLTLDSTLMLNGGTMECAAIVNNSVLTANGGRLATARFDNRPLGFVRLEGNATVAGTQIVNAGEISINSDTVTVVGDQLINAGVISGFGRVGMQLQNGTAGEIRTDSGGRITFLQSGNTNSGRIEAINGATVEFRGDLTNGIAGRIVARDGTLRFAGGLTNEGNLITSNGLGEVFGNIVNDAMGRITIASQSTALFYDDLINQGTVHVGEDAMAIFLETVSGDGTFTGNGTVRFEGTFMPGNSPAHVQFEGDLELGTDSRLMLELYGNRSVEWDRLSVEGMASLDGGLQLSLVGGFAPQNGEFFNLLDFAAVRGQFDTVSLPKLHDGLAWDTSELYETGSIRVVPEPAALPLFVAGLLTWIASSWRRGTTRTSRVGQSINDDSHLEEITKGDCHGQRSRQYRGQLVGWRAAISRRRHV